MSTENIQDEARKLIEKLPEGATWDDVMHVICVRQASTRGLADSKSE